MILKKDFFKIFSLVLFLFMPAYSLKVHFLSLWAEDPVRSTEPLLIRGEDGGWYPGTEMTHEGGDWYYYVFSNSNPENYHKFAFVTTIGQYYEDPEFFTPAGLTSEENQDSWFNIWEVFQIAGTSPFDEVWIYLEDGEIKITDIPPESKVLYIFNPWPETAPLISVNGGEFQLMRFSETCGWFVYYTTGDGPYSYLFKSIFEDEYYGASGLLDNTPIDLNPVFATRDTVFILPTPQPGGSPVLHNTLPPGIEGQCSYKLAAIVRDFSERHTDFEDIQGSQTAVPGMVYEDLGEDDKPVRNPAIEATTEGAQNANFDTWFNTNSDNGDLSNYETCVDLEITKTRDGMWRYASYDNPSRGFFPIDDFNNFNEWGKSTYQPISGDEFLEQWIDDPTGADHNFHFTMELHAKFTYKKGQVFSFSGDDDVWVFINHKLAVDLGGVHIAAKGGVELDKLGLTEGVEYTFDLFYCERKRTASNLLMKTSIYFEQDQAVYIEETSLESGIVQYDVKRQEGADESCAGRLKPDGVIYDEPAEYILDGKEILSVGENYEGGITISSDSSSVVIDTSIINSLNLLPPGTHTIIIRNFTEPIIENRITFVVTSNYLTLELSANPPGGTSFYTELSIELIPTVSGEQVSDAQIYYTINGSMPDTSDLSEATLYTEPITISESDTIRAVAFGDIYIPVSGEFIYIREYYPAALEADPGDTTYTTLTLDVSLITDADRIYYTIDGSDPDTTNDAQLYSVAITISGDVTIKAIAVGEGFVASEIGSWTYNQELPQATVSAEPGDTIYSTVTLEVSLITDADRIYYTTDGSDPDTANDAQLYSAAITISGDVTLKAIAVGEGFVASEIGSWTYNQELPQATVSAEPGDTTYSTVTLDVILTTDADRIYYTTDGSDPDTANDAQLYSAAVVISGDVTLKAIAIGEGYESSEIGSWTYIQDLPFASIDADPGNSTYTTVTLDITLTSETGNSIYYTTDGSDPDTGDTSQLYKGPITIAGDVILRAVAFGPGYLLNEGSWTYDCELPSATLSANPGDTAYSTISLDVILSTNADRIYYTTDGSTPDTNNASQLYSDPVYIYGDTVTIRAIAVGVGYVLGQDSWVYIRDWPQATVNADPGSLTYTTVSIDVTLTTDAERIYYTTDSSDPDTNNSSQLYSGSMTIYGDVTLKAIAVGEGYEASEIGEWIYDQDLPSASIDADPGSSVYETVTLDITLISEEGNSIYYTTDGTDPDTTDTSQLFKGLITISGDIILKAIAVGVGYEASEIGEWIYDQDLPFATITADPGSSVYETVTLEITLTSEEGNSIYYTIDGTDPDTTDNSQIYTGPVTISGDITLSAVAFGPGYLPKEGNWTYDQDLPPATLSADPGDGTTFGYTLDIELISNAERIYYTDDGSEPDTDNSDQLYTGTITISSDSPDDVTIKAIAVGEAYSPTTGSWTYTREYLPEITALPSGMKFVEIVEVSLFIDNLDAKIYYTLDGTEPDTNSSSTILYTEGSTIKLTETTTLKARAFAPDIIPSHLLTEIYTRIFVVKDALYRDSNGDGRIDMAELLFDELPDSLPTEVVLTNPFNNSEKDTVGSSGISWLNGDVSTLTVNINLNRSFTENKNTGFEAGYYGNITGGLYLNDAFKISDGVAPVINSATYCPGEIIDIETLERAFDTLVVYFSEDVEDINYDRPFVFKTEEGTEYSFDLKKISIYSNTAVFEVIKDEEEENDYPFKDDSIKINYEAGVSDLHDNKQDIEDNRYVKLNVKPKPYKLVVNVLSPVDPAIFKIPEELIAYRYGIDMTTGLVIVVDFLIDLEDDADRLKCDVSIFDPVGNIVEQCKKIGDNSGNLQIGIVEGSSTRLIIYWSGQNQKDRQVGKGMYIAKINILDHNYRKIKVNQLIGVKK